MGLAETAKLAVELNMTGNLPKEMSKAQRGLKDFDKQVARVQDTTKTWGDRIRDMGPALKTGLAVGAGIIAVKGVEMLSDALGDSIKAAAEDEASIAKLGAALKANVRGWDGNTAAIEANISSKMDLAFGDEDLRASLALLVAATHDVTKAQELQTTAMDLARFKGISLQSASEALVKVEGGQYRLLTSLGIKLKDNATQTEALAAVQRVAGGQAKSYAKTAAGQFERLNIALGEVQESIGRILIGPATDFVAFLNDILDDGRNAEGSVAALARSMREDLTPAIKDSVAAAGSASSGAGTQFAHGTIFGSMADGARDLINILQPHVAEMERWATETATLGDQLGATRLDLIDLAKQVKAGGGDFYEYRGQLETLVAALPKAGEAAKAAGVAINRGVSVGVRTAIGRVADMPGKLSEALKAGKGTVRSAMEELKWALKHPLANVEHIAWLKGKLASKSLARGLRSNIPAVRNAAAAALRAIRDELSASGAILIGWNVGVGPGKNHGVRPGRRGNRQDHTENTGGGGAEGKGRRAMGGPVMGGASYLVGERGPEMLHMGSRSGYVTPNRAMAPIVNVYPVVTVSATATLNGQARAVATNRARIA